MPTNSANSTNVFRQPQTDIVTMDKIYSGDTLDTNLLLSDFCLVNINSTTIARVGGYKSVKAWSTTYFCHTTEDTTWRWVQGPNMISKKFKSGCSVFDHLGHLYIIVVGGTTYTPQTRLMHVKTVEFFDLSKNVWIQGKNSTFDLKLI